jgi:Lhr-like helicase
MADRTVPSPLTDLEWIQSLGARLWLPGRRRSCRPRNGYGDAKRRITQPELERIRQIVQRHNLPYEIVNTRSRTELAVYLMKGERKLEVLRLTHHHVPSISLNANHRRRVAARIFAGFAQKTELK